VNKLSTSALFDATQAALIEGRWSVARRDLDDLSVRSDNTHMLCAPSSYKLPAGDYGKTIADRIDMVNSRARLASLK
jgi:hypothetical protein